ncbi:glycosyltransferase family protein [Microbulbifer bruguierae]|uniref:Glycosyltransferase family protein n=1 Tax=Microbulbifer bruguierae TaxID=3029061 RepID=A0ABY8NHC4_9GAMM|nr:MJ1255/VC2487 family glycosyltransferase [Microbulbifer bruguierae]WGL17809.1 glycosyltransferase family protein [Microbulbifer bruguierae]
MKILYGVQGTGNGHISRARAMAEAFQQFPQLQVQWLFSGRPQEKLFAMEAFGDYWWREGLTFVHKEGKIDQLATTRQLNLRRLLQDIRELPVQDFDLVISDFEPVSAWAAKKRKCPSLGLGHQYAFNYSIPTPAFGWTARSIMKVFAPVQVSLGMHWYHFGHPILPPIAHAHEQPAPQEKDHVLVYLPFEYAEPLLKQLAQVSQTFIVYGLPTDLPCADNITLKAPSVEGFRGDVATAKAVICNSGFELIAETLTLGKPILTRPLKGQFEQEANAMALDQLQLARVVDNIDAATITHWLTGNPLGVRIQWPDVAAAIVNWVAEGRPTTPQILADSLWESVVPGRARRTAQNTDTPKQEKLNGIEGSEST